jgi:hypothetical protein
MIAAGPLVVLDSRCANPKASTTKAPILEKPTAVPKAATVAIMRIVQVQED